MISNSILKKYAWLVVKVGANVQPNQVVSVTCNVENYEIAREVVDACYRAGAKEVILDYGDSKVSKIKYVNESMETLCEIPNFFVEKQKYFVDNNFCKIAISSPDPLAFVGVDPVKMQKSSQATQEKIQFSKEYTMSNRGQWSIIAAPCKAWANKVFPALSDDEAIDRLWEAVLTASRVSEDNDPVLQWEEHINNLKTYSTKLNNLNLATLHFKNSLGTDITVELVHNHLWCGGAEYRTDGVRFAPNIPTEEIFSMPHKYGVNGVVASTKPLSYQGTLIENFSLTFKDGKVTAYEAKRGIEALKSLLEYDDGSSYLGEVALVSNNSPISNMDILFYNTLFDENASCHFALGQAYSMNIRGGTNMSKEQLKEHGVNGSHTHVDFMFGSACMNVVGVTKDNKKIQIIEKGNFIL